MSTTASASAAQPIEQPALAQSLTQAPRLVSLDAFRGLTIWMMLVVNNIADDAAVGRWFRHAGFLPGTQAQSYRAWFAGFGGVEGFAAWLGHMGRFPLFTACTLADFVMPWFVLIIGLALPFSTAASLRRGESVGLRWARTIKRSAMLVILGWFIWDISLPITAWLHSSDPRAALRLTLGMNVLQLLGWSYLLARVLYCLPARPRLMVAAAVLLGYWVLLRFYPQPVTAAGGGAGSLTAASNALSHIYDTWAIGGVRVWGRLPAEGPVAITLRGFLSVPPTAATMLIGAWAGELVRRQDLRPRQHVTRLMAVGAVLTLVGFLWAFDLPFNKPVWTPSYLLYTSGLGLIVMAAMYGLIDVRRASWWSTPLVVFGTNAIGVYVLSLMLKIWLLNFIRVPDGSGGAVTLSRRVVLLLQDGLGSTAGAWAFTAGYLAFLWLIAYAAYRKRWVWKL